jgi:hypothetical protein
MSCKAVLHHGPGHQSKAYCKIIGKHSIHYTTYGNEISCYWKGDEAITGYFDEPPETSDKLQWYEYANDKERQAEDLEIADAMAGGPEIRYWKQKVDDAKDLIKKWRAFKSRQPNYMDSPPEPDYYYEQQMHKCADELEKILK